MILSGYTCNPMKCVSQPPGFNMKGKMISPTRRPVCINHEHRKRRTHAKPTAGAGAHSLGIEVFVALFFHVIVRFAFFNCYCVSFCFVIFEELLGILRFDGYFSFNSHSVFLFFFQFGLLLFSLFIFVLVFHCLARKCRLNCTHRSRMPRVCCSRLRNVGLSELSGTVKKVAPRKASCSPSA